MKLGPISIISPIVLLALDSASPAQDRSEQTSPERARANFTRPGQLGSNVLRVFPDAPAGIDQPRPGTAAGHVELLSYDSRFVTGTQREANVYLPSVIRPNANTRCSTSSAVRAIRATPDRLPHPGAQAKYSAFTDREQRDLAGLPMGGGQTIHFGLAHLDTFVWLGGFSAAPNTKSLNELIPDPAAKGPGSSMAPKASTRS